MKTGALVGVDKYGNKYFEDNRYFFGKDGTPYGGATSKFHLPLQVKFSIQK